MKLNDSTTDLLRQMDPGAPQRTDPAMHQRLRARLDLTPGTTDTTPAGPTPARPHRTRAVRRGLAIGLATAAVGAALVTVNRPAPAMATLTPEALATWTARSIPATDTTEQRNSCLREYGDVAGSPDATYLLEERRGDLTSMIARYDGNTVFCIVGPDDTGLLNSMSGLDVDVTDRPAQGITAAVSGDDLDGPLDERVHYITGRYAPDVTDLSLILADGRTMTASMQDGWYTAWWSGDALSDATQLSWTDNGTVREARYSTLPY